MIREVKFYLFTLIMRLALKFLPKDATETWKWVTKMPIEK